MQGGDAQLGKDLLAEPLRLFHRRLRLDRVRSLDQRADDEDLMPFGHFFTHQRRAASRSAPIYRRVSMGMRPVGDG